MKRASMMHSTEEQRPLSVVIVRSNHVKPDPRVEKEARSLVKAGYRVSVIAWDRMGTVPDDDAVLDLGGYSAPVHRCRIRARYSTGISNLVPMIRWQLHLLWCLFTKRRSYDIVHCCDFDTVLPALLMKMLIAKKVVYDIFDFYVDTYNVPRLLKGLVRSIDLWAIGKSDALILVSESRKEQIAGSKPRQIHIIRNTPQDEPDMVAASLDTKGAYSLRLAYVGSLLKRRYLLEMVEIVEQRADWELHIAGYGILEDEIARIARDHPNITYHGRVDYKTGLAISRNADVLFALYNPEVPNYRYSDPNKIYEAMMLGKPIIVAKNMGIDRLVLTEGIGVAVEYGNNEELIRTLAELSLDRARLRQMGTRARSVYEARYSWLKEEEELLRLYQGVMRTMELSKRR